MKQRVREMEEEAAKLREMQAQVEREMSMAGLDMGSSAGSALNAAEVDGRSVYVGNVDYGATPEELQAHFQTCGTINRITILCDRWTGHPKGYAYVEFADPSHVANAMALNESLFRNRLLKVTPKRGNVPGFNARGRGRGAPRGGAFRARGGRGSRSRRASFTPY